MLILLVFFLARTKNAPTHEETEAIRIHEAAWPEDQEAQIQSAEEMGRNLQVNGRLF